MSHTYVSLQESLGALSLVNSVAEPITSEFGGPAQLNHAPETFHYGMFSCSDLVLEWPHENWLPGQSRW